jgi:hypothetical protein
MLSLHLAEKIDALVAALGPESYFARTLGRINEAFSPLPDYMKSIASGGNALSGAAGSMHGHFAQLSRTTREISARQFFSSYEAVRSALVQFGAGKAVEQEHESAAILADIEIFAGAYDTFVAEPTPPNAVPLILRAVELHQTLVGFLRALRFVRARLKPEVPDIPGSARLSIIFSSRPSLSGLVAQLQALNDLYSEVARMIGDDVPLQVVKVETGTSFIDILGSAAVITFVGKLIADWLSYLYRNHTREGKIRAIPQNVASVESVLELSSRLKEAGMDATRVDEQVQLAALSIANDMNALLQGQREVVVNDKTYSLETELQKQLQAPEQPPLLTHEDDIPPTK